MPKKRPFFGVFLGSRHNTALGKSIFERSTLGKTSLFFAFLGGFQKPSFLGFFAVFVIFAKIAKTVIFRVFRVFRGFWGFPVFGSIFGVPQKMGQKSGYPRFLKKVKNPSFLGFFAVFEVFRVFGFFWVFWVFWVFVIFVKIAKTAKMAKIVKNAKKAKNGHFLGFLKLGVFWLKI